jgi:hypothetical protein
MGCVKAGQDAAALENSPDESAREAVAIKIKPKDSDESAVTLTMDERSAEKMDRLIDTVLGSHEAYRRAYDQLKEAVEGDDRAAVAALVRYPLKAPAVMGRAAVENEAEFIAHYDRIMTRPVVQAIRKQRYQDLAVSQSGLMIGTGKVWINGACVDHGCATPRIKVIAIQ